uniref:interferon-induced, double-stranded RNA-activated protein kinase-like n=1 Tax=Erigeron canadensis TaxID=72917 RepID=UPI001CB93A7A|nr:interferon-induced, double-stranded RNA-activated protein kinase-like [Erigeron canadensis]
MRQVEQAKEAQVKQIRQRKLATNSITRSDYKPNKKVIWVTRMEWVVEDSNVTGVVELKDTNKFEGWWRWWIRKAAAVVTVQNNLKHLMIRLNDIELATDNFSEKYKIDTLSNAFVYKAKLECLDKEYLSTIDWKNNDELPKRQYTVKIELIYVPSDEVYNKIEILGNCNHRNIETLLGFCKKGRDTILVYEYVSTRCFRDYLDKEVLTWEKRLKICLDIAHGLNYLHHEMDGQKRVIYHDLDSGNIVLDDNWVAKVIGFEKSRYLSTYQDDDALYLNDPVNFYYYTDPEFVETGKLKRESDIYSFGAIMFEILCGMTALVALSKGIWLDVSVWGWLEEGVINQKVARILKGENGEHNFMLKRGPNKDSLDTFINIATQCFAKKQNQRPTIKIVINELEKALSFQENNKDIIRMSLEDINLATQDFNCANVIGGGGFERVYKGEVAEKDGNGHYMIVAKKLDIRHGQGEKQFYNELQILYEYKHENIIDLVGYSDETDEKIIVYEHAPKGSLDKYLSDTSLTWKNRLKICIDFATGLDFLHGGGHGQEVVIHRDIKAANILLFEDWKAKVGDFGLSMISTVKRDTDYVIDHACGTKGYLDPLYLKSGFLTVKSDIYSFGVVLFEILCGRTTFTIHKLKGHLLPSFIKQVFKEGKQGEVIFHAIKDEIVPKSLTTFQNIAYQCLDNDREKRPTTKEILTELKKAMEFQVTRGQRFYLT